MRLPLVFLATAFFTSISFATPIIPVTGESPYNSGSYSRQFATSISGGITTQYLFNGVVDNGDQTFDYEFPDIQLNSSTNAVAGTVKVAASVDSNRSSFNTATAEATIFDILTFNFFDGESGLVKFSYDFDGFFSNTDPFGASGMAYALISIVDVTGLEAGFFFGGNIDGTEYEGAIITPNSTETFSVDIDGRTRLFSDPNYIFREFVGSSIVSPDVAAQIEAGAFGEGGLDSYIISTSGIPQNFQDSINGEFLAENGRQYAFLLTAFANVVADLGSSMTADFDNTATFRFTDIPDGFFTSASGSFLTIPPPPPPNDVDEPSSLMLIALSLVLLVLMREFRRSHGTTGVRRDLIAHSFTS